MERPAAKGRIYVANTCKEIRSVKLGGHTETLKGRRFVFPLARHSRPVQSYLLGEFTTSKYSPTAVADALYFTYLPLNVVCFIPPLRLYRQRACAAGRVSSRRDTALSGKTHAKRTNCTFPIRGSACGTSSATPRVKPLPRARRGKKKTTAPHNDLTISDRRASRRESQLRGVGNGN